MIPHSRSTIGREESAAVDRVLQSGNLGIGAETELLEMEMGNMLGRDVACVSSGTAALHLALLALGVRSGDHVAIPTHTCPSVFYAVNYLHAIPLLYDCGPMGLGIDLASLHKILPDVRSVVIVHTYGFPNLSWTDMGITVPVIEDCAHSLGAAYRGFHMGKFGAAAIFSFYATKMIAAGECGAVAGNSEIIAEVKRRRSPRGADDRDIRYPYSPSDLNAAIARVQMTQLERFVASRRRIAEQYTKAFQSLPVHIADGSGSGSCWYRYIMETNLPRQRVIAEARKRGVQLGNGVLTPVHRLIGENPRKFPHSERAYHHVVSLPIYPGLDDAAVDRVIAVISEILA